MKFFDDEFIKSLTLQPAATKATTKHDISDFAEMSEIPLFLANTAPAQLSAASDATAGGCASGNCSCQTDTTATEDPFDPSGIQSMLAEIFAQNAPEATADKETSDSGWDPAMVQEITDNVEWGRLENIVRLSKLGDGWAQWDSQAAGQSIKDGLDQLLDRKVTRRTATMLIATGLLAGLSLLQTSCTSILSPEKSEEANLNWQEYFKGNFRLMTEEEKAATVSRLARMHELKTGKTLSMSAADAEPDVLYGYAFNISKCRGYMDCVRGCLQENNQDRASDMRYIRIHEHKQGQMNFDEASDDFFHEVPAADHFYIGTQCFHCENPPCVNVCPVQATWKEPDGIVVVDYDWCIGCRYCLAACPYDARRFNWADPVIPEEEINRNQHYLGNRLRKKGVTEKCTFCIQRTRTGKNPACVEACPTGARIFGNLLDPNSEIRWVLSNKKVFRLKEDLGTEPKFWYFMD